MLNYCYTKLLLDNFLLLLQPIHDELLLVEDHPGSVVDDGIFRTVDVKIVVGINRRSFLDIFEGEQIAEFRFPRAAIAVSSDAENRAVTFRDGTFLQLTVWFARFDDNVTASFDRWTDDSRQ